MAVEDGRSMCTCPSLKLLSRSHTTLKCSGQEPTQVSGKLGICTKIVSKNQKAITCTKNEKNNGKLKNEKMLKKNETKKKQKETCTKSKKIEKSQISLFLLESTLGKTPDTPLQDRPNFRAFFAPLPSPFSLFFSLSGCRHITPIFNLVEPACSHMLVSLAHILQHLITHPSIAHAVAQAVL